ncbi:MAG: hypothetical protein ACRCZ9_11320 [Fusobacteriaceae bacterium]
MNKTKEEKNNIIEQNNKIVLETKEEKEARRYKQAIEIVKDLNLLLDLSANISDNEIKRGYFKITGRKMYPTLMVLIRKILESDFK